VGRAHAGSRVGRTCGSRSTTRAPDHAGSPDRRGRPTSPRAG
jgi:hypothetical protein